MTDEAIKLVQELGFPIALSIGLAFALYSVIRYILKEKVEDTLKNFGNRHDNLIKELDDMKKQMHIRFDQERDDIEKLKKWVSDGRSDNKIIIDYILKGK